MPAESPDPLLIEARCFACQDTVDRLRRAVSPSSQPSNIGETTGKWLATLFERKLNPLIQDLSAAKSKLDVKDYPSAQAAVLDVQNRLEPLLQLAQSFLGGAFVRNFNVASAAPQWAETVASRCSERLGIEWSPVVIFGADEGAASSMNVFDYGPQDRIIQLPLPRWDVWQVPLVARECGFWAARYGHVDALDADLKNRIDNLKASVPDNPQLAMRMQSQTVKLWYWYADVLALFTAGPTYAYAVFFLHLNPVAPFGEAALAEEPSMLPSDAHRAATLLYVLRQWDVEARPDAFSAGPCTADIQLLEVMWTDALRACGNLDPFTALSDKLQTDLQVIYAAANRHFSTIAEFALEAWAEVKSSYVPRLRGADKSSLPDYDLERVIGAAWFCRARHTDRIADLATICQSLLGGTGISLPVKSAPVSFDRPATRLLASRLHDLETDLDYFRELLRSPEIHQTDRDVTAGRFFRLLSVQDWSTKHTRNMAGRADAGSLLSQIDSNRPLASELRQELLDFMGGVLMRRSSVDGGICTLAESLLFDLSSRTGVNWISRVVIGKNPVFSPASEMVYLRFPDWDIWNLPLIAHEFGHVTALATPAFREWVATEIATIDVGHPNASDWKPADRRNYATLRERHLHEFFGDSFAVYTLGPAFLYNVVLLHFNPWDPYLSRGDHPSHAERVTALLEIVKRMNEAAGALDDEPPYDGVLNKVKRWCSDYAPPRDANDSVSAFHQLKAVEFGGKIFEFLDKHYRLGAAFPASEWRAAQRDAATLLRPKAVFEPGPLRQLLNLAWAARVRYSQERAQEIEFVIRKSLEDSVAKEH